MGRNFYKGHISFLQYPVILVKCITPRGSKVFMGEMAFFSREEQNPGGGGLKDFRREMSFQKEDFERILRQKHSVQ